MSKSRTTLAITSILAAAIALTACAAGTTTSGDNSSSESPAASFNEADVRFAQSMRPHHSQAVEMSDMILTKDGISPDTVALAEEIKAAQEPEIELLDGFLDAWGEKPTGDMGGMDDSGGMNGMMSKNDMNALDRADGTEAERLFLTQMTEHHNGAIEMATAEIEDGENADAISLADNIVATQQTEIDRMQKLLSAL